MLLAFVGAQEVIPLLVLVAIVAAIFSVLTAISSRNSRAQERLERISRPASLAEIEDPKLKRERFHGMVETAKALSGPLMPRTELEQSELKITLANAGFRSDSAVAVYLGLRIATLAVFLTTAVAVCLPRYGLTYAALKPIVIAGCVGFYLPSMVLWFLRKKRQEEIFLSLPDAMDLL